MLRYIFKQVTPPILLSFVKFGLAKLRGGINFDYKYSDWSSAEKAAGSYDDDIIFKKVTESARLVSSGNAVYERDSVIFDEIQYSWPLLAGMLLAAASVGKLRVIDFGGSLGTTFMQNRQFFNRLPFTCQWRVVEQDRFVEVGQKEFSNKNLSFYQTIKAAKLDGVDVVLFGGSICYVRDPEKYISQAVEIEAEYIIFDRTPISGREYDTFAVQNIPAQIYKASFPIRAFGYGGLQKNLESKYDLVEKWTCDLQADPKSTAMGFIFKRKPIL